MKIYVNMMVYNELPFLDHVTEVLLRFCDYIVMMDNGSTDGSREWVGQPRNRVIAILNSPQGDSPHYAGRRNQMLPFVPNGEWVLKWDPDELPSDGMVKGIQAFLEADGGKHGGWEIPIYHLVHDRASCLGIEFGYHHLRLFRKTSNAHHHGSIHEQIALDGKTGTISTDSDMAFIHLSHLAEARLRRKAEYYAKVNPTRFHSPEQLTRRLALPTVPLPDHITFPASDEWLEEIKRAE